MDLDLYLYKYNSIYIYIYIYNYIYNYVYSYIRERIFLIFPSVVSSIHAPTFFIFCHRL